MDIESLYLILKAIGLLYCTGIGLMMVCAHLIILIRLTDYAIQADARADYDNKE